MSKFGGKFSCSLNVRLLFCFGCDVSAVKHPVPPQCRRPPNSPHHPMRGRSLARRFRGSVRAARRVALPERTGRARVSGRTLCRQCVTPQRTNTRLLKYFCCLARTTRNELPSACDPSVLAVLGSASTPPPP